MNIRASLFIALPSFLLLLGGCLIIPGNGNGTTGGAGGEGNTIATSSSSSSSTGSGMGGAGGQGGSAGAGVGGGGSMCAKPEDGILDVNACAALNTQATGNICGPNKDLAPLANGTCTHGVDIFQGGAFDVLVKCLQGIEGDMANACDDAQVEKCVGVMYQASCPSPVAAKACDDLSTITCAGSPFDTQGCLLDTVPLQPKALQDIADCMSDPMSDPNCQKAYDDCFTKVLSF